MVGSESSLSQALSVSNKATASCLLQALQDLYLGPIKTMLLSLLPGYRRSDQFPNQQILR